MSTVQCQYSVFNTLSLNLETWKLELNKLMRVFLWRTWLENHLKTLRIDSIYHRLLEMSFQLECSGQRILGRQGYLVCKSPIILVMKHSSKWSELVWWRQNVLTNVKNQQAQFCLTVTKKGSNSTKLSSQCHAE